MLHGEPKLRIMNASPRPLCVGFDHDQPAVDLLAPVHARGILLPNEAAFGEADTVQLGGVAFQPEKIADFRAPLADAKAKAMRKPPISRFRRSRNPAAAEFGNARIG